MIIMLGSDMIMLWLAVFYLVSEIRNYFKELRQKQSLRYQSFEFTQTMQTLFDLRNPFEIVDCMDRNLADVDEYVNLVLVTFAPELAQHHKKFQWVLLARRKIVRTSDMDMVAQDCYRYFMCIVMQLRMYGELRSLWALERFKASFRNFVELRSLHSVAHRTWVVAKEMRRIAAELDKIETLDESHAGLIRSFSSALDDVRELIGQP